MPAPAQEDAVRALLYSVNGTGLGHLTRLLAIGRWLRTLLNGLDLKARTFFLTCSDADHLLAAQGFPSFKLPSRTALRKAHVPDREAIHLIRGYAESALEQIRPDILVVDTFPTGTYDELLPALGREDLTRVFIFREQRQEYAERVPYEKLLANFDLLLIPHPAGSFEIPFGLPPELTVRWTGDIVFGERNELWTKARARETLGVPRGKTVAYTAAGGGGDPANPRILATVADVVRGFPELHLVVGAGPLYSKPPLKGRRLTWTRHYPISRLFRAFDFAISSSGYNTVSELLYFGLPPILYAQERQADDQLARARRVAAAGGAIAVEPFAEESLREAVGGMLDERARGRIARAARKLIPENGARTAAEAILRVALPGRMPEPETPEGEGKPGRKSKRGKRRNG